MKSNFLFAVVKLTELKLLVGKRMLTQNILYIKEEFLLALLYFKVKFQYLGIRLIIF